MGKGARIKAVRAEEQAKPKIINTIAINMLNNGGVNVSGPITEPLLVIDVLGKALNALSAFYAQKGTQAHPIIQPGSGLLLPK